MSRLLQDVRFGLRMLGKTPGITIASVLTLALGIGMTTAIFSFVYGILLRPLPYPEPDRLVMVWESSLQDGRDRNSVSPANFVDWHERSRSFEALSAYDGTGFTLTGDGEPERMPGVAVSRDFFDVLGIDAEVGRTFLPEEFTEGQDRVVLLQHGFWKRRFAGDETIVGRTLTLNDLAHTVVGVLPEDFQFPSWPEIWKPLPLEGELSRNDRYMEVVGRLVPGVTPEQAQAEMSRIAEELAAAHPDSNTDYGVNVITLNEEVSGDVRPALIVLLAAAGLLLLIASANVAGLQVVRAVARRGEIAIRLATGARRGDLARQLLVESLVLALIGGLTGLAVAWAASKVFLALATEEIPRLEAIGIDGGVLIFSLVLTLLTGVLFGLFPLLQSFRVDLASTLSDGVKTTAGGARQKMRAGLIVAEVALAFILLVGAGLLAQSFLTLRAVDLGFNPDRLLTTAVVMPDASYPEPEDRIAYLDQMLAETESLPQVRSAGLIMPLPMSGGGERTGYRIEDRPLPEGASAPRANFRVTSEDFFQTMEIPLIRGRIFNSGDVAGAPDVVVINQSMAEQVWPDEEALGKRVSFKRDDEGNRIWSTIVGVVGDVQHESLVDEPGPELYVTYKQEPWSISYMVARTEGDALGVLPSLRSRVYGLDPNLPLIDSKPLNDYLDEAVARPRFNMALMLCFAAVALVLAMIGIYGVLSSAVSERRREFGIRMAFGATGGKVLGLVLRRGLILTAVGLGLGLVGAYLGSRLLESLLYGVAATEVTTYALALLLLAVVALLACLLPAIRATRSDPATALR